MSGKVGYTFKISFTCLEQIFDPPVFYSLPQQIAPTVQLTKINHNYAISIKALLTEHIVHKY